MFEKKKTLIVVYKDELLMNQLKKMVETHDDNDEGIVGTRDDSINIISWTEKVWNGNKEAGEYSRAVTPQIRQAGNRLSGLAETAYASLLA